MLSTYTSDLPNSSLSQPSSLLAWLGILNLTIDFLGIVNLKSPQLYAIKNSVNLLVILKGQPFA